MTSIDGENKLYIKTFHNKKKIVSCNPPDRLTMNASYKKYGQFQAIFGAEVVVIVPLLDLQLPEQSVIITTHDMSSNPAQARCTQYNIM